MKLTKLLLTLVLGLIGVVFALKLAGALLGWAVSAFFAFAVPAAIVLGILYIVYRVSERKSLSGGRNSLP